MSTNGRTRRSLTRAQMMRVISSPSISTIGFLAAIRLNDTVSSVRNMRWGGMEGEANRRANRLPHPGGQRTSPSRPGLPAPHLPQVLAVPGRRNALARRVRAGLVAPRSDPELAAGDDVPVLAVGEVPELDPVADVVRGIG